MSDDKTRPATMKVSGFKAINAGAMVGFCDVTLPSGMVLNRCSIFVKDGKTWASEPSKQVVGRDGTVQRMTDGKVRYEKTVSFIDRATETRWSDQVIEAFQAADPEALA